MSILNCPKCGEEYDTDEQEYCKCEEEDTRQTELEDLRLEAHRERDAEIDEEEKADALGGFGGELKE